MAGAVVNPGARVGAFCILNTNSSIDHDCILEDYASLAPGVVTGGGVVIGRYTAIGIRATVVHGVRIGEHSVIGAGATVLHDIPDHVVAYGTPARVVRNRQTGDPYLNEIRESKDRLANDQRT
jgi:acetyltransferase-like isoleucine patch superfamily enzyme